MSEPRAFFFGCWKEAGHYLCNQNGPVWGVKYREIEHRITHFSGGHYLDGGLAPRITQTDSTFPERDSIVFAGAFAKDSRGAHGYTSEEAPQGQFLRHHLDNGFTAISWWDRKQGDTRGACNSTVLLEGVHDTATMLRTLAREFPHVLDNLTKAGIVLTEVKSVIVGQGLCPTCSGTATAVTPCSTCGRGAEGA